MCSLRVSWVNPQQDDEEMSQKKAFIISLLISE